MEYVRPFGAVAALALACEVGILIYWYLARDWGYSAPVQAPVLVMARPQNATPAVAPPPYRIVERREKAVLGGRLLELKALAQEPLTEANLRALLDAVAADAARGAHGPPPSRLRLLVFSSRTGIDEQGINWVAFYWTSGDRAEPELMSIRKNSLISHEGHER